MPIDKSIDYSAITPEIKALTKLCLADNVIEPEMYVKYAVNRGLRDLNGNGVLTGLTEISEIQSSKMVDGEKVPCEGKLFYRGVDVEQIVSGFIREKRYGFEETVYLLLFGALPDEAQLDDFKKLLAGYRSLPTNFVRDVILKAPNADMMNTLARSVLTLYSYDARATDNSTENVLRQCLQLIALFPMLSVYGYQAYSHYVLDKSLFIHNPCPSFPPLKTCCTSCARMANIPSWRPESWIWRWCCTPSTAAATTRPSPCMWLLLRAPTPILPWRRLWPA